MKICNMNHCHYVVGLVHSYPSLLIRLSAALQEKSLENSSNALDSKKTKKCLRIVGTHLHSHPNPRRRRDFPRPPRSHGRSVELKLLRNRSGRSKPWSTDRRRADPAARLVCQARHTSRSDITVGREGQRPHRSRRLNREMAKKGQLNENCRRWSDGRRQVTTTTET